MCDTFWIGKNLVGSAFFAKNSDRDANEPQPMHFVPAGGEGRPDGLPPYTAKHSVWLSKPSWMYGAEMGVNEEGVAVGNEATFNKVKVPKTGVLGMEHLRVALEIAKTAEEALRVIIENTEKWGQGGNGGYENPLYYHNSYLICDPDEAYVLDTVGKSWAYKKLSSSCHISNKIGIKDDFDAISRDLEGKVSNFEKRFTNPVVTHFAGAYERERRGNQLLRRTDWELQDVMAVLSDRHTGKVASMENIGMIAGGLVSSQATASLIYDFGRSTLWYTEGPCPELQLFKPLKFGAKGTPRAEGIRRWKRNNLLFRAALWDFEGTLEKLRDIRDRYQQELFDLAEAGLGPSEMAAESQDINETYVRKALEKTSKEHFRGGFQFKRYWRKANRMLAEKEESAELKSWYKAYLPF